MADNYLGFNYKKSTYTVGDKYKLSDFNGFVVNDGVDLTFFNPSRFSHEFITPNFGNQSFFLGTTRENREFTYSIVLSSCSLGLYKEFLNWINPKDEGILYFDYNPNFKYDVKVNNISEAKFTVNSDCVTADTYNIELTIGFITKHDWAAQLINTVTATSLPSSTITYLSDTSAWTSSSVSAVFSIHNTPSASIYNFKNYVNADCFLQINGSSLTLLSIYSGATLAYAFEDTVPKTFTLYTEYGLAVDSDNECIAFVANTGPLYIKPNETKVLTITYTGTALTIVPVVREQI